MPLTEEQFNALPQDLQQRLSQGQLSEKEFNALPEEHKSILTGQAPEPVPQQQQAQPPEQFQMPSTPTAAVTTPSDIGEFGKQFVNKAAAGLRVANILRQQFVNPEHEKIIADAENELNAQYPTLFKSLEPTTTAGQVGAAVGTLAEPITLMAGGLGGAVAEKAAGSVLLGAPERMAYDVALQEANAMMDRAAAQGLVNDLVKQNVLRGAIKEGGFGAGAGAVSGAIESMDDEGKLNADTIAKRAAMGGMGGALLGAGTGKFLESRPLTKFAENVPEGFDVVSTPAQKQIADGLWNLQQGRTLGEFQDDIDRLQRSFDFKGVKNPQTPEQVERALGIAQGQYDKAMQLADKGILTKDQAQAVAIREFNNAVDAQGVKTAIQKVGKLGSFSNQVERYSALGSATGTNIGEIPIKLSFAQNQIPNEVEPVIAQHLQDSHALRNMGWTNDEITDALQHVESTGFHPEAKATKSMVRNAWEGELPSQQEMVYLQNIRNRFDALHQSAVDSGMISPEAFVEGYVPIRNAPGQVSSMGARKVGSITDPTFAQERVEGMLVPGQHETDIDRLMQRYTREVTTAKYYSPIIEDAVKEKVKLLLSGQNDVANTFDKYLKQSLNISADIPMEQIFGNRIVGKQLPKVMDQVPADLASEIYSQAAQSAYKNMVMQNPKTVLMHWIQPEFTLPAEVGVSQYGKARIQALTPGARSEVRDLMSMAMRSDLPATEEVAATRPQSRIAQAIKSVGDLGDKLQLTRPFKAGEQMKRYTALIAGQNTFNDAFDKGGFPAVQRTMQNFLPAERSYITKAFQQGGPAAGANAMALIVDRRANFSYSLADKPDVLTGGLGKFVPFTSFFRNVLARYQGDIQQGNYANVAKRAASAIAAWNFFESLTGKDFTSARPDHELKRAVTDLSISPIITGPARALTQSKGDRSQALMKVIEDFSPVSGPVRMQQNMVKTGNIFGLKEADRNDWLRKLVR